MKFGDRDLKFPCESLCLLSFIFGFTTDNEFECKQVLHCCHSVSVSAWD